MQSESINGCTVIPASSEPDVVTVGPTEMQGAYLALLGTFPPDMPTPSPHVHPYTDEAFYVGAGTCTFLLGDRRLEVGPGGFVFVPRGTVHSAWNASGGVTSGLLVISPGDAEHVVIPAAPEEDGSIDG